MIDQLHATLLWFTIHNFMYRKIIKCTWDIKYVYCLWCVQIDYGLAIYSPNLPLYIGITVNTPVGEGVMRVAIVNASLDLPARATLLNMKQYNGASSCFACEDQGVNQGGHRWWPYNLHWIPRTHQSLLQDAVSATVSKSTISIKGARCLVILMIYAALSVAKAYHHSHLAANHNPIAAAYWAKP